ncbi:MAG: hypothetical protein A3C46_02285 [Deltaproteobacteria bacterium RIFCSPHIGHO2_02_FULL_44_16]|nr:MAG: hypothetical protein A3C46_02285 [Deltaproteobacteria bacterium RIFCSPHIGHO2_02_FULL_44_16]
MCGAVSIQYDPAFKKELAKFFSENEIQNFERNGEIVFAYWDKRPMLPIRKGKEICFIDWGNRDEKLSLPKTGWARLESLLAKKWDKLKPKVVLIPAKRGCEKKVWFDLDKDIKAVLVQKDGMERVYMITEAATSEYKKLTKHERMPRLLDKKSTESDA